MVVSILAPYYPIVMAIGAFNIVDNGALKPYDYAAMHSRTVPYPWNTIIYLPSSTINFGLMNIGWISILTAIPIFLFFGKTTDAVNSYRRLFLHCGLDAFFPGLHREYDPDRPLRYAVGGSSGSNTSASNTTPTLTSTIGYASHLILSHHLHDPD